MKVLIQKDTCTPVFRDAPFTNSQNMEATQVYLNWPMEKEYVRYIYMCIYNEILANHKYEWNFVICSNVDGSREYYA